MPFYFQPELTYSLSLFQRTAFTYATNQMLRCQLSIDSPKIYLRGVPPYTPWKEEVATCIPISYYCLLLVMLSYQGKNTLLSIKNKGSPRGEYCKLPYWGMPEVK